MLSIMDVRSTLKRLPVLQALPEAERQRVCEQARVHELDTGQRAWERGDAAKSLFMLVEGQVRLVESSGDRELVIALVQAPGDLLCVAAPCASLPYCCESRCVTRTTLLEIPRAPQIQGLAGHVHGQVVGRAVKLCRRLREMGGSPVEQRVAVLLVRLADERGSAEGAYVRLPKTIARRDLASMSGCANETLIRVLARFEARGLIVRDAAGLLLDPNALAELAQAAENDA